MEELLDRLRAIQYKVLVFIQHFGNRASNTLNTITVLLSVLCIGNVIWQIGFSVTPEMLETFMSFNRGAIVFFGIVPIVHIVTSLVTTRHVSLWQILYTVAVWTYILMETGDSWLSHKYVLDGIVVILSAYELSSLSIPFLTRRASPTTLFAGSFIMFIAVGTGLLLMPRCHYDDLTFLQALFTATSSVCVSGLSTLDIGNSFTPFGHTVILLLIQVGGLGVMTFTCFFALSLTGKGSLQNRIIIKDLISADNMSDIFQTLKHIMYVTFIIEAVSAWCLYYYFRQALPGAPTQDIIFTSIFHAVSSFCNAGISNINNGLANPALSSCDGLHLVVTLTVIFGGAGFPLQSAAISWTKYRIHKIILRLLGQKNKIKSQRRIISAGNRLIFYTHFSLLVIGTLIFLIFEWNYSMSGKPIGTKLIDALFYSSTARTAGFMYGDILSMQGPSYVIFIMLMFVGCAPMSTGGGIKVTTFGICMLNLRNTLLGRENIEIFGRRISKQSVNKAFAVVMLQLGAVMISTFGLKVAMPEAPVSKLLFESFSALSTVGLSMDMTPLLNTAGQMIVIADMFIGRIGVMAFVLIFVTPHPRPRYKYPSEDIMI